MKTAEKCLNLRFSCSSSQHFILSCNGPDVPSFHLLKVKPDLFALSESIESTTKSNVGESMEASESGSEGENKAHPMVTQFVRTLDNNGEALQKINTLAFPR